MREFLLHRDGIVASGRDLASHFRREFAARDPELLAIFLAALQVRLEDGGVAGGIVAQSIHRAAHDGERPLGVEVRVVDRIVDEPRLVDAADRAAIDLAKVIDRDPPRHQQQEPAKLASRAIGAGEHRVLEDADEHFLTDVVGDVRGEPAFLQVTENGRAIPRGEALASLDVVVRRRADGGPKGRGKHRRMITSRRIGFRSVARGVLENSVAAEKLCSNRGMFRPARSLVSVAFLVGLVACDGKAPPSASAPAKETSAPAVSVRTGKVELRPWPRVIEVNGNLEAHERSTLGAKIAGRVIEMSVDVGSEVRAGSIVARIDDVDAKLRVAQVESLVHQARALLGLPLSGDDDTVDSDETAQVRLARAVLAEADAKKQRSIILNEQGLLDDAQRDEALAAASVASERVKSAEQEVTNHRGVLEQRRAELAIARQQLADTAVRAPYDGVVVRRLVGRGDFVTVGTPLVVLSKVDPLRLLLEIPERDAAKVRPGQETVFTIDGADEVHRATIARIPPELRSENRMLVAEADIANTAPDGSHPLRAGSFVRARIVIDPTATVIAVQRAALRSFAGVHRVLTIVDGKANEVMVTPGREDGDWIELLTEIAPGTRVILDPGNLATGKAVTAAN